MLQVFISIALILGDGLYNFLKILAITAKNITDRLKHKNIKKGGKQKRSHKQTPSKHSHFNFFNQLLCCSIRP